MKNKYYLISLFLLGILFFNFSFGIVNAFYDELIKDIDDDGVNDDFEELNKRYIEIDGIEDNEIHVESIKRSEKEKDQINTIIIYDEDGIHIGFKYKSKLESEFELVFGIFFREIIEFVDIDEDGIYNHERDHTIQKVLLNNFKPVIYETWSISSDSSLHYLKIQTENNVFIVHFYFVEEFALVENSLITPTQLKIDIEIKDFDYIDENSQLAINTRLHSEINYEEKEDTEDEKNDYSSNERGVITTMNSYTGFLTWKENAFIDWISKEIRVSKIMAGQHGQSLYFNYPRGEHIYHDPKIGIEGILIPITASPFPTYIVVLIFVIGALSIGATYLTYHFIKRKSPATDLEKDRDEYFNEKFLEEDKPYAPYYDERSALLILLEENSLEKLSRMNNLNITVVSEDFFEKVNRFVWDLNEKEEFIREMLVLTPIERQSILEEMLAKSLH